MSITNTNSTTSTLRISDHATARWAARTPVATPIGLRHAWATGLVMQAPEVDGDEVRLYPPYDLLMVKRGGIIRTVLHADYRRLDATGYQRCHECGDLHDPLTGSECQWCGTTTEMVGAITISYGGSS